MRVNLFLLSAEGMRHGTMFSTTPHINKDVALLWKKLWDAHKLHWKYLNSIAEDIWGAKIHPFLIVSVLLAAELNQSVWERSSLLGSRSGWRGWSVLSRMDSSLFSILLSITASMVSGWQPITELAFSMGFFRLLVLPWNNAPSPADHSKEQCTGSVQISSSFFCCSQQETLQSSLALFTNLMVLNSGLSLASFSFLTPGCKHCLLSWSWCHLYYFCDNKVLHPAIVLLPPQHPHSGWRGPCRNVILFLRFFFSSYVSATGFQLSLVFKVSFGSLDSLAVFSFWWGDLLLSAAGFGGNCSVYHLYFLNFFTP